MFELLLEVAGMIIKALSTVLVIRKSLQTYNNTCDEQGYYVMRNGTKIDDTRVRYHRYNTLHYLL
jgi:hypothetical protein